MKRIFALITALVMLVGLVGCGGGGQQTTGSAAADATWDAKDVQLLVAAKAGGGTDVIGRIIAQGMSDATGKNVVVVNQTEGGGAVCFNNVQTASAKGDMMGFFIVSFMTSYISGVHDTSPVEDVQFPVVMENISGCPFVVVNANAPYNTIQELVDYIKANPGKVTFGTQLGTGSHYQLADFCDSQGLEVEFLESGSDADKVTGLMGNLFEVSSINANQANQYVQAGELKALMALASPGGTFDKNDLAALANVPTVEEAGYKSLRTTSIFAVGVPNGVPASVMEEIYEAVKKAAEDPTVAEQCAKAGYQFKIYNPTESKEFIKRTYDAYAALGKTLGLNAEGR